MRAVNVMLDEELLSELDQTQEVRTQGRSAVLRELISAFLRRRRERQIDDQYARAYAHSQPAGVDGELAGWEDEGVWPRVAKVDPTEKSA